MKHDCNLTVCAYSMPGGGLSPITVPFFTFVLGISISLGAARQPHLPHVSSGRRDENNQGTMSRGNAAYRALVAFQLMMPSHFLELREDFLPPLTQD